MSNVEKRKWKKWIAVKARVKPEKKVTRMDVEKELKLIDYKYP